MGYFCKSKQTWSRLFSCSNSLICSNGIWNLSCSMHFLHRLDSWRSRFFCSKIWFRSEEVFNNSLRPTFSCSFFEFWSRELFSNFLSLCFSISKLIIDWSFDWLITWKHCFFRSKSEIWFFEIFSDSWRHSIYIRTVSKLLAPVVCFAELVCGQSHMLQTLNF